MLPMYELITKALKLLRCLTRKFNLKNFTKTKFSSQLNKITSIYCDPLQLKLMNNKCKCKIWNFPNKKIYFNICHFSGMDASHHHTITLHHISSKVWTEQVLTSQSKMSLPRWASQTVPGILSVVKYISEPVSSDPPGVAGWSYWPATLHKDLIYWAKFSSWIPAILIIHVIIQ